MQGNNSDRIEERMPIDLKSLIDFSHISDVGIVTFINYNTAVLETLNGYEFSVDICNSVRSQSGSATFKSLKNEICEKMKGSSGGFDDIKYDMIQRAEMDLKKSHSILKLLTLCKEYASLPKDFFQEFNILILDKDFLTEILKLMNDNTTDETSFKDLKQKLTQKLSEINEHLEDVKNLYNDKIELRELELSRLNDESQEKEEERQNAKEEKFTKEKDKIVARLTSLTKEELFELNTTRNIQQLLDTEIENVRQSANVTKNLLEAQHASEIFRINREKTDIENQLNREKTLLQIERDQLNLRVDVLRQDIDRIGQENNDKEAQLAQITNNLNHLQQEKDVLDQEIIQINADAQNRIAAANANAQDRIAAANADAKTQIAAANADAKTQIAAANADAQAYKDNEIIRITQAKENEINRIINEKDNEILRITEAKHAAEQKNKTNEVTLLTQITQAKYEIESLGITIKHKDSVIDSLESELAKSKEKYDSTLNKTKKLIEETNKRYKETESRLETSENNVAGKERAIRKIKAKNNEIARKLKLIEYTNNQLTRTVEASSKKLKEKESTHKEIVRRITEENKIKIEESSGKTEEEIEKVRSDAEERIRGAELEIENARLENIKREEEIKTKIESLTNELSVLQNQIITLNDDNTNKDKLIEELNTAKHMLTVDHSNQIQELEKNKKDEIEKIKSENTDSKEDLKKKIKEIEEKSNLERVRFNEEKDRKDIELEDIQKKLEAVVSENKKELIALNQKQYKELADNTTLRNLAIETAKNEAKTEIETMRAETDLKLQKIIDEKEKLKVERETNENLREINETLKKNIEEITEKSEEEINELKKKFEEGTELTMRKCSSLRLNLYKK